MKKILLAGLAFGAVTIGTAFSAQATVVYNGLVGYWAADENANDSSSTANDGTFSGTYVLGKYGQAFDLSTGPVSAPDNSAYAFSGNFSVGFWFDMNGATTATFIGQDEGGGSLNKWFVDFGMMGSLNVFDLHYNTPVMNPSGSTVISSNEVTLATGWNQFTLVREGDFYHFYLNGINIGSVENNFVFPTPSAPLKFSDLEGGYSFGGLMDDVTLYGRALSADEVKILADVPTTGTPVPEPTTMLLFGTGLIGLAAIGRRKSN